MEFASEKRDGRDGAERDNRDGDVSDSRLVDLRSEKESQNQDDPPVDCEDYERVAGNVAEYSLENADGGNVWNLACEQERGDKADNARNGTCDKFREALAQIVIHDAEIRTWRFPKSVCDKACDSDGGDDSRVFRGVSCARRNGAVNFFDGFLAEKTATKEE